MSNDNKCEFCENIFKNSYNLKYHLLNNKSCLKLRGLSTNTKFICKGCNISFVNNVNLNKHNDICKVSKIKLEIDSTKKELDVKNETISNLSRSIIELKQKHENKLNDLKQSHEKSLNELRLQNDKLLASIEKMTKSAIERPTTVTTNNTNNIRTTFSDTYFLEDLKEEDIKRKFVSYLTENVFFAGQKGIAQLCNDHIIKTKDNKVLLACTDTSRKKFKYIDDKGNVKEDHEARSFTEKISKPIKDVSKAVYDTILSNVDYEKENIEEEDYGKKERLHEKTMRAINCYSEIYNFDDQKYNQEFMHELSILTK
jgi:hypothetical protein